MQSTIDCASGRSREHSLYMRCREGEPGRPRLSLLHGNGFSSGTLMPLAEALPESWNIWLPDIPGHGCSGMPGTHHPDWQDMADSIAESLRHQAHTATLGPLIGIGHSFGGMLTLLAACRHPAMFSEIILLDPPLHTPGLIPVMHVAHATGTWRRIGLVKKALSRRRHWPDRVAMRESLQKRQLYQKWDPAALEGFVQTGAVESATGGVELACDPAWEAAIFASTPQRLWAKIKRLTVPTTIVNASDNAIFFARAGAERAARVNPVIKRIDHGDSHCFPMEDPAGTAELIENLLGHQ
ncbi:MAG: hypothetical protein CSB44_05590 [Gammaproteobacteria bacterium]|nr:MAG: hypothetical protein CSB44_05590 [Gammaproteobacteria bacterium]